MSDTLTIRKYQPRVVTPLGTNRRKKYLILFLALIAVAAAGMAYQVVSSGILAPENPGIPVRLLDRINLERQVLGLEPVTSRGNLAAEAVRISREARIAPLAYQPGKNPAIGGRTDIVTIPRLAFAIPGYDPFREAFSDPETAGTFRDHALDPAAGSVGIGVSGDTNNYYIVTKWA